MATIARPPKLFALGILVVNPSSAAAQQNESWAVRIAEQYSQSVVEIEIEKPTGAATGSGFFVDSVGTIVTNVHVIRGATTVRVRLASGDEYSVPRRSFASRRRRSDRSSANLSRQGNPSNGDLRRNI